MNRPSRSGLCPRSSALRRWIALAAAMLALAAAMLALAGATAAPGADRPRVVVLTDITNEPDDEQSLVRLLVYANEFDVEGLIATTSTWLKDRVSPETIRGHVEAYGQVRERLLVHAPGYPPAEQLLGVVKAGRPEYGMAAVGEGKSSEGSRHLVEVVDRPDSRRVWVLVWGGANTLAQALWDVRATRSQKQLDAFVGKLRVYTISDQDDSGRWMRESFPRLFYIASPSSEDDEEYFRSTWSGISGDRLFGTGTGTAFELVENPWLRRNVIEGHGPLGARYPPIRYLMEGDSPSFLHLIPNGLGNPHNPGWGGWGGRYVLHKSYAESRPIWTSSDEARDTVRTGDGREHRSVQATIWRWREAYQHDFAARMDWCVAEEYEDANHNPRAVVWGNETRKPQFRRVRLGEEVTLDASGSSDPDGDDLRFRWIQYPEAGTHPERIQIEHADRARARFVAPRSHPGGTLHVILEVRDDGDPSLYAYRRLIFQVVR
jgi:hypothetical protein